MSQLALMAHLKLSLSVKRDTFFGYDVLMASSRGFVFWGGANRIFTKTPCSIAQPMAMGQKENPWGPQVAGSIFPFTNRFFGYPVF